MMRHLPNILTLSRLALLPVIMGLLFLSQSWAAWVALGLYVLGAVTDWLDGALARKYGIVSAFGTFLDPIADKIFVIVILVLLVGFNRLPDAWMIVPIVILVREFMVAGLREYLGPANVKLPVTRLAKWKTTVQMVATGMLLIGDHAESILGTWVLPAGRWALAAAAVLTLITGWAYLKAGLAFMRETPPR